MDVQTFPPSRRPFLPTPDTSLYFPSANSEAAIAHLKAGYDDQAGLALIDGEPGVGKTLTVLRFLETLPDETPRVMLPMGRFASARELYQAILFDLGAAYHGLGEQELRLAVAEQWLAALADGRSSVLVIDEAHHLSGDLLEEIRLLGNLESRTAKAAFVVLVAQPSLRSRLSHPEFAGVSQRIAVRGRIEPLPPHEAAAYLAHRLRASGKNPDQILTDEASELLATGCRGVPRLLNQAANLAFTLASQAGESTVDVEAALESLATLGIAVEEPETELPTPKPLPTRSPAAKRKPGKRRSA